MPYLNIPLQFLTPISTIRTLHYKSLTYVHTQAKVWLHLSFNLTTLTTTNDIHTQATTCEILKNILNFEEQKWNPHVCVVKWVSPAFETEWWIQLLMNSGCNSSKLYRVRSPIHDEKLPISTCLTHHCCCDEGNVEESVISTNCLLLDNL